MFSNTVKITFFSDVQYYAPTKLCKTAGSIHLFKITDTIKPENVTLRENYIWDTYRNLPTFVTIKFRDKFKIRYMMKREPLFFHIMLKQGFS